jgi:hypothetical protein
MNILLVGLAVLFFVLAGYYGAVRAILLDISIDRYTLRHEDANVIFQTLYWRRLLRMVRLAVVALGCFYAVARRAGHFVGFMLYNLG